MAEPASAPDFRAVSLTPGSVVVECLTCGDRIAGITAAAVMGDVRKHHRRHIEGSRDSK
jgi:hypothetical protein